MSPMKSSKDSAPVTTREILIGRQPIFDRDGKVAAFELLFRNTSNNEANVGNDSIATVQVIVDSLSEIGLERVLGGKPGFLNIGEEFLLGDEIFLLPSDQIVLEILETVPVTDAVINRVRELKQKGYRMALDDYVGSEEIWAPLLELVDIVKVDLMGLEPGTLAVVAKRLAPRNIRLLAEKVESEEDVRKAMELDFFYFQGFFFARPVILKGKKTDPMQSALLGILALVMNEGSIDEIDRSIKPHIDLSISLIRVANVVGNAPSRTVETVRQAILAMGVSQLSRWIQLLLFSSSKSDNKYARPTFHLAVTRARLMEILAGHWKGPERPNPDQAFMVGMLSLADTLMATSLEEILPSLPISQGIREALAGKGPMGYLLELSRVIERSKFGELEQILAKLPIPREKIAVEHMESIIWADEISALFT